MNSDGKKSGLSFALFFTAHGVSATFIAYVLAWLLGGLSPLVAIISLGLGSLRARRFVMHVRNRLDWQNRTMPHALDQERKWDWAEIIIASFVILAAYKHFAWLMPSVDGAIMTLSPTNFGDLPLHINYIRAFANGIDFPPLNPIFASEPLRYPLGVDLYNALWEVLGVRMQAHLFLTGVAATVATLFLLREMGGAWAMAGFFLAGAAVDVSTAHDWKSFFLAVWLTQRGMLWALPVGLVLLLYLRPHLSGERRLSRRALSRLGWMWGILPLIHAHAFIAISLTLFFVSWTDFGFRRSREFLRRFFLENRALSRAVIPATFFIFYSTAGFSKASVLRWRPFWMMPLDQGITGAYDWLVKNFNVSFLAIALGVFILFWENRKSRENTKGVASELGVHVLLFGFFACLMFAPWEWDNIKLLLWPWVLIFAVIGRGMIRLQKERPMWLWPALTAVMLIGASAPGIKEVATSWKKPSERSLRIWSEENLNRSESLLRRIQPGAIFASSTSHLHDLAYFGRLRAVGYIGNLWSHAIPYHAAERDLATLMTFKQEGVSLDWHQAARHLGITHIFWGPEEKSVAGTSSKDWQAVLPKKTSGTLDIYEFKSEKP